MEKQCSRLVFTKSGIELFFKKSHADNQNKFQESVRAQRSSFIKLIQEDKLTPDKTLGPGIFSNSSQNLNTERSTKSHSTNVLRRGSSMLQCLLIEFNFKSLLASPTLRNGLFGAEEQIPRKRKKSRIMDYMKTPKTTRIGLLSPSELKSNITMLIPRTDREVNEVKKKKIEFSHKENEKKYKMNSKKIRSLATKRQHERSMIGCEVEDATTRIRKEFHLFDNINRLENKLAIHMKRERVYNKRYKSLHQIYPEYKISHRFSIQKSRGYPIITLPSIFSRR